LVHHQATTTANLEVGWNSMALSAQFVKRFKVDISAKANNLMLWEKKTKKHRKMHNSMQHKPKQQSHPIHLVLFPSKFTGQLTDVCYFSWKFSTQVKTACSAL